MNPSDYQKPARVIAILGPTASGKTSLAIHLAKRFDGEIISCDSMQLYQGMNIATAMPTKEERIAIKHHLIDFLPADTPFSVSEYVDLATKTAEEISRRGKNIFLCGGTGLYADAFLQGMTFPNFENSTEKRQELEEFLQKNGLEALKQRLVRADAEALSLIDEKNPKRVLRAVEICESSGQSLRAYREENLPKKARYPHMKICLDFHNRELLYDRINRRVDEMLSSGLIDEARQYYQLPLRCTSSQAIGYKELKPYFDGEISLPEAVEKIKQATRHYAKRQQTWFRRQKTEKSIYLYVDEQNMKEKAENICEAFLKGEDFYGGKKA